MLTHCGQLPSAYIGAQNGLESTGVIHLWNCSVCRTSFTGPSPVDVLRALRLAAGSLILAVDDARAQRDALNPDFPHERVLCEMMDHRLATIPGLGGGRGRGLIAKENAGVQS